MKKLLFIIAILFTTALSFAQVSVRGYYRSNGTYVQPHQRTYPNETRNDNYSTIGNVNPYTGKAGTKPRDSYSSTTTTSSNYSAPTYRSTSTYSAPTRSTYSPSYTAPVSTYSTPSYTPSPTIYTGSRGGQYYVNSNGNKTYVSSY
jgi:type II secretory pathway pseudopilin PulG